MNKQEIKEIRTLKDKYIEDAQKARKEHEWAGYYILSDKIHLLEWILGERETP
jgi:hypothetical protein